MLSRVSSGVDYSFGDSENVCMSVFPYAYGGGGRGGLGWGL